MTEYWKSQAKKFCDFCKCWLSDNKASIAFHENGKRHQQAVENKLYEIRKKGARDDMKAQRNEAWLDEMNRKAMKDYRTKDLEVNPDITARIFNEKRSQRDAAREREDDAAADRARRAAEAAAMEAKSQPVPSTSAAKPSTSGIGPQIESKMFQKVEAPTSGTKWHIETAEAKVWYEAKSPEGYTYYWHVETNESRWEPPPEGYLSIKEQMDLNKKAEAKEKKRQKQIAEQQSFHGKKDDDGALAVAPQGPAPKVDPYGGWQTVEAAPEEDYAQIDYQTPTVKQAPQANVTVYSDKLTKFEEKATPSLGGASEDSGSMTKPSIVFRKRKMNSEEHRKKARRRDYDDE